MIPYLTGKYKKMGGKLSVNSFSKGENCPFFFRGKYAIIFYIYACARRRISARQKGARVMEDKRKSWKERQEADDGIIEGRNAVIEALRAGTPIDKVYIARGETDAALGHIAAKAKASGAHRGSARSDVWGRPSRTYRRPCTPPCRRPPHRPRHGSRQKDRQPRSCRIPDSHSCSSSGRRRARKIPSGDRKSVV